MLIQGRCLCGAIAVEINGEISDIIHCHCSLCRKSSGTAYATNGFINSSEFSITQGQALLSSYEVKPGKERHFCSRCGSPIYSSNSENPQKLRIRLGLIDTPIEARPLSHNFVSSKATWDNLDDTLPRYDGFEPSRENNKAN